MNSSRLKNSPTHLMKQFSKLLKHLATVFFLKIASEETFTPASFALASLSKRLNAAFSLLENISLFSIFRDIVDDIPFPPAVHFFTLDRRRIAE